MNIFYWAKPTSEMGTGVYITTVLLAVVAGKYLSLVYML